MQPRYKLELTTVAILNGEYLTEQGKNIFCNKNILCNKKSISVMLVTVKIRVKLHQ